MNECKDSVLVYTDKKVSFSSTTAILDSMKAMLSKSDYAAYKTKQNVLTSLLLLLFQIYLPTVVHVLHLSPSIERIAYPVFSFLLFLSLVHLLMIKNTLNFEETLKSAKSSMKEVFDLKSITYVIGSPDEVATALLDEKQRHLWDPSLKEAVKTPDS